MDRRYLRQFLIGAAAIGILTAAPVFTHAQTEVQTSQDSTAQATSQPQQPKRKLSAKERAEAAMLEQLNANYDSIGEVVDGMRAVKRNNLYGYVNSSGAAVIPPIYKEANDFESGLARVKTGGNYGLIDREGKVVVAFEYDTIGKMSSELYPVNKEGKWGYINRQGVVLNELKYENAVSFYNGLGVVKYNDRYGAIDTTGAVIIPITFEYVVIDSASYVTLNNRQAPIDSALNIAYERLYDRIGPFGELGPADLAMVTVYGKSGLIGRDMQQVLPTSYDEIHAFKSGRARVKAGKFYGYIDESAKLATDINFETARDYIGDYAMVSKGINCGIIDLNGEFQPLEYEREIARIKRQGKIALMNPDGALVSDRLYDKVEPFVNDRSIVSISGFYGFISPDGSESVKPIYQEVANFEGNVARVCATGQWGLIDKFGQMLTDYPYESIEPFIGEMSRVKRGNQYGYINKAGKEVVHATYDYISEFEADSLARMKNNGKFGLVEPNGFERVIATYDVIEAYSEGFYAVGIGEKFGFITPDGKTAIKMKYERTLPFVDGLAPVCKKDKWGLIDYEGHTVIPIKYEQFTDISGNVITAVKNGEITRYDRNGKKIKD